jgi:hypothetical protein
VSSKCQKLSASRHVVTFRKTWIFFSTAVRTWNRALDLFATPFRTELSILVMSYSSSCGRRLSLTSLPCTTFCLFVWASAASHGCTAACWLIVPPALDVPTLATRCPRAYRRVPCSSGGSWNLWAGIRIGKFCLNACFHGTFRDLSRAANLRHGTHGFTSLPKEGVLRNPALRTHIIRVWDSFVSACVHYVIQNPCYECYFWYINLQSYCICSNSSCTKNF